jgi:hypothetical protein
MKISPALKTCEADLWVPVRVLETAMDHLPFDPYDFFGYIASGLLLILGMQFVFGFPVVLGKDLKVVDVAALVLAVYVAGQIIAGPAKAILEDLIVDKILRRPSINLFRAKRPWIRRFLFPGFYKPLPPAVQDRIREKLRRQSTDITDGESIFMIVRYCPEIRNDEKVMKKLDSFRDKYGFNRNLSFSALLAGIAFLTKVGFAWDPVLFRYGCAAVLISVLLFYRYLKFFRQYSYEMFNCYGGGK